MFDSDYIAPITPEGLQVLAEQAKVQLRPEEIEPLCRVYCKLEQMKTLIRKPRDNRRTLAHTFSCSSRSLDAPKS